MCFFLDTTLRDSMQQTPLGKWTAASELFKPIVQDHQIRSEARDGAGLSVNGAFGFLSAAFCNRGVLLVQFVDKLREVSVDAGH